MDDAQQHPDALTAPLWLGIQGLARLWDRRAAESTETGAAEAYHRAAAEAQEVLRALVKPTSPPPASPDPAVQADLGL